MAPWLQAHDVSWVLRCTDTAVLSSIDTLFIHAEVRSCPLSSANGHLRLCQADPGDADKHLHDRALKASTASNGDNWAQLYGDFLRKGAHTCDS